MAIQFGTKALIEVGKEIGKVGFGVVTGGGIVLASLLAWTGTTDLQTIKTSVEQYTIKADQQVSALLGEYNVTVGNANAEIGEYKDALVQANSNIDKLITAYKSKQAELTTKEQQLTTKEQELANLQTQLEKNYVPVDEVNQVIEKANAEINQANTEVTGTKEQVQTIINGSGVSQFTIEDHKEHFNKLDTTGDKSVHDIDDIVPSEQPQK